MSCSSFSGEKKSSNIAVRVRVRQNNLKEVSVYMYVCSRLEEMELQGTKCDVDRSKYDFHLEAGLMCEKISESA